MPGKRGPMPFVKRIFADLTPHPGAEWLRAHFDQVSTQYPGQWISVSGNGVWAQGESPEDLEKNFRQRHPNHDFNKFLTTWIHNPSEP